MSASKLLSALLGCFLFVGFAGNAFAHSGFHLTVIAPGYGYAPSPAGYWQCVNFNPYDGSCVQSVWVQTAYVQPAYYGPGQFYFYVGHHHHRYWG